MNIMQALKETELLWRELERTGNKSKTVAAEGCGLEHVLSYHGKCPCCEYDRCPQSYLITCALCPIWDSDTKCFSPEEKPTALFTIWRRSTSDTERQFYAKQIADRAKENYDLLYTLGYRIELERENVY